MVDVVDSGGGCGCSSGSRSSSHEGIHRLDRGHMSDFISVDPAFGFQGHTEKYGSP